MIRYALQCDNSHMFESWFPDSSAFEEQAQRGLVACPVCDSQKVHKAIMAPHIAKMDRSPLRLKDESELNPDVSAPDDSAKTQQEVTLIDDKLRVLQTMVRELRAKIVALTIDVGADFPEEARKIHAGDAAERPIRGEATIEEARALLEEGIEIMPIPILPEDRN